MALTKFTQVQKALGGISYSAARDQLIERDPWIRSAMVTLTTVGRRTILP